MCKGQQAALAVLPVQRGSCHNTLQKVSLCSDRSCRCMAMPSHVHSGALPKPSTHQTHCQSHDKSPRCCSSLDRKFTLRASSTFPAGFPVAQMMKICPNRCSYLLFHSASACAFPPAPIVSRATTLSRMPALCPCLPHAVANEKLSGDLFSDSLPQVAKNLDRTWHCF